MSIAVGTATSNRVSARRGVLAVLDPEAWLWAGVLAALIALRVYPDFVPSLSDDSFQYLSMAQNALAGQFGYTSLIHFDAERSFGVAPAPMVTFPAAYSLAIALVSLTGLSLQTSALLVSAGSTLACVLLLAWIVDQLGLSRWLRTVLLAIFALNAAVVEYGASVLTEAPFTLLALLGVALLISARVHAGAGRWWYWIAAGLMFGAAYFVRYAGLFFVLGLAVLVVRYIVTSNRLLAAGHAVALAIASTVVFAGMARNLLLVGNWRGGNEKIVSNPLLSVLVETARAINGIFLGPGSALHGGTFIQRALCAALFAIGMAWIAWTYLQHRSAPRFRGAGRNGAGVDLFLLTATYGACMFYAGLTTVISYEARMFVPLIPLLLLLLGLVLHNVLATIPATNAMRRLPLAALLASFSLYVYLNLLPVRDPQPVHASATAKALDSTVVNGKSARAVVLELTGPDGVIIANNGQAVGYTLGRRTVSLVGPQFSAIEWDEKVLRETIGHFNAAAIVIFGHTADLTDDLPSPLVERLSQGDSPGWMKQVYRSDGLLVYAPRPASP